MSQDIPNTSADTESNSSPDEPRGNDSDVPAEANTSTTSQPTNTTQDQNKADTQPNPATADARNLPDVLDRSITQLVDEAQRVLRVENAIAQRLLLLATFITSIRIRDVLQPGVLPTLFREAPEPQRDVFDVVADGLIAELWNMPYPCYREPPAYLTTALWGDGGDEKETASYLSYIPKPEPPLILVPKKKVREAPKGIDDEDM